MIFNLFEDDNNSKTILNAYDLFLIYLLLNLSDSVATQLKLFFEDHY